MELARLIPGWALHARWFLWPALAFAVVWGHGELARVWITRKVGGLAPDLHWAERARRAERIREAASIGLVAGVIVGFFFCLHWRDREPRGSGGPALFALLAGLTASVWVAARVQRTLLPARTGAEQLRGLALSACLLGPLTAC